MKNLTRGKQSGCQLVIWMNFHCTGLRGVPQTHLKKSLAVKVIWNTFIAFSAQILAAMLTNATSAQRNNKDGFPDLPAIPYNYSITKLPTHLVNAVTIDVVTNVDEGAQFNHLATLGRVLFYDKNLSRNSLVSCSSCHKRDKGFDDPSRFSIGFEGRITSRSAL
ncbi:MAG: hypothetical protein GY780_13350 [bacterium]|nr:hypothetical protein [bacterium]